MKFLFLFVCLFIFNFINIEACPTSYYAISGGSCLKDYIELKNSECVQLHSNYLGTPAQGDLCANKGYTTKRGGSTTVSNAQFTWSSCGSSNFSWIFYWVFGACDNIPGDTTQSIATYTITSTSKFFIVMNCYNFILPTFLFEMSSSSSASQGLIDQCLAMANGRVDGVEFFDFSPYITCPSGYSGTPCTDIDECSAGTSGCAHSCANTAGSFTCSCNSGYRLNANGKTCDDIDECSAGNSGCAHSCANTAGSFTCSCNSGYRLNANGKTCDDIDECSAGTSGCSHTCTNTAGSFTCSCPSTGYRLIGKTCVDIDECTESTSGCAHSCLNSVGSFTCSCNSGYELDVNGKTCSDINECTKNSDNCEEPTTCNNLNGSFNCTCNNIPGYRLGSNGKSCVDIDECNEEAHSCKGVSTCSNTIGSYLCICPKDYNPTTDQKDCIKSGISSPLITSFSQKPNNKSTFIVIGEHFIINNSQVKIGTVDCLYLSGDNNTIECKTGDGLEVIGDVIVTANSLVSYPYDFIGSPFIISSTKPSTQGGLITITGRNFPIQGTITVTIGSVNCPIESKTINEIQCTISEGSGNQNSIILSNGTITNTDNSNLSYDNPTITSISHVFNVGGSLTITGTNFGVTTKSKEASISIGKNKCNNIEIKNHTTLTCTLSSSKQVYSNVIDLNIDGVKVSNVVYFEYSKLEGAGQCECNENGECTLFGCVCADGYTGTTCNETSIELIPISNPNLNKPTIEIGNVGLVDQSSNGFGYKISITSIQELDFNDNIVKSYDLLSENWQQSTITSNQWTFNKTLDNQCYLECEFKYFKQSANITFADNTFTIPSASLKLSFKTDNWPFQSKLNSLRIIVSTNTLILQPDQVDECSINKPITTSNYNDHLWTMTENSESGIVARFVKYATVDDIPIIAKIETLESNDKTASFVGISLPYFSKSSIVDPDFSVLLNVDKDTGDCSNDNNDSNTNWKVATGVTIGVVSAVAIAGTSFYYFKLKKSQTLFLNLFKK